MTKPADNLVYSMYDYPCYKLRISIYLSDRTDRKYQLLLCVMKIFYIMYTIPIKLQGTIFYNFLSKFIAKLAKSFSEEISGVLSLQLSAERICFTTICHHVTSKQDH